MKNTIQAGVNITTTSPSDVLSGAGVLMGKMFGVAASNALTGADLTIVTEGAFAMPKIAADAFTAGDAVHFDAATGLMGTAGDKIVGYAIQPAPANAATVAVRLVPSAG